MTRDLHSDRERVLQALQAAPGSAADLAESAFGGALTASEVGHMLVALVRDGLVHIVVHRSVRPRRIYRATPRTVLT